MLAKKLNRVYTIDENDKNKYLKNGFDIINEKGEVIENAITKTIAYSEHNKIVEELKAQVETLTKVGENDGEVQE